MKRARRTRLEIIGEILTVCCNDGGVNKTKIVYSTNLNFKLTETYLRFLIEKGHITAGSTYQITKSGIEYLNKIIALQTSLNSDKPSNDVNDDVNNDVNNDINDDINNDIKKK